MLFLSILIKKARKVLSVRKKVVPLQRISRKCPAIGVWCNGNTADSGPAFPGSSPGTPTKVEPSSMSLGGFFFGGAVHVRCVFGVV